MKPTPKPKEMQPGAREVPGSSLTANAFGMPVEIKGKFAPPDLDFYPKGPTEVTYYNGAQAPPAGGGAKAKMQIKSGPMGSE